MLKKFFSFFLACILRTAEDLAHFAAWIGLIPMSSERYLPIRPADTLLPQTYFTLMIVLYLLGSVVLFFVRFEWFLLFALLAPIAGFFLFAFVCRAWLEYCLQEELRRMTPEELRSYERTLKKNFS